MTPDEEERLLRAADNFTIIQRASGWGIVVVVVIFALLWLAGH